MVLRVIPMPPAHIPDGGLTVPSVTAYKSDPKDISPDKRYLSFPHACLFKRQNVSEYRDVSEYIIGADCPEARRQPAIISQGSLAIRHGADAIAGPNLAETRKAGLLEKETVYEGINPDVRCTSGEQRHAGARASARHSTSGTNRS